MGLNRQNGNMYEFVTHTWNPLAGECPHRCPYCSTKTLITRHKLLREKYSGPPRIVVKELCNLGSGNTIFVCNMVDLFASHVPPGAIIKILEHCDQYNNAYLFQTKNPHAFNSILPTYYPIDSVFCTTLETNRNMRNRHVPDPKWRAKEMEVFIPVGYGKKAVTIEPVLDFDLKPFVEMIRRIEPSWVAIGADSKKNGLSEPSGDKVLQLIERLQKFTEVRQKRNLARLLA